MTTLKTTFSDGDVFYAGVTSDTDKLNGITNEINGKDKPKINNERAINLVSATYSGVLAGSSQVLIDKFLDSTGQNNTVDTGNTTCVYNSTNKDYVCSFAGTGASTAQNAEATMASTDTNDATNGYKIYVNLNCTLLSITKHASCGSSQATLCDVAGNVIDTANFIGDVATFSSEQRLFAGTYYQVKAVVSGAEARRWDASASYPYNNTYINFTTGIVGTDTEDARNAFNIISVNVKDIVYSDSIVQSAVATVTTGMTKVFVTPLMYEALATGDGITADVSIDNGSNYTTAVPINTWTAITSANGTQLIVKANLNTNTGTTTPKVLGWNVLLE